MGLHNKAPMTPAMEKCLKDNQEALAQGKVLPSGKTTRFAPTEADKRLKAEFWASYEPDPLSGLTEIPTLDNVLAILPFAAADLEPKFASNSYAVWFMNKNENKAKLEYLFGKALDVMMNILENEDPKCASARVQCIKLIAQLANKVPLAQQVKEEDNLSKFLSGMDKASLTAFIEKGGQTLKLKASRGDKDVEDGD